MADLKQQPPRQAYKRQETARYVVAVDHQIKSSYDTHEAAKNEADRILRAFPKLNVTVSDAAANSVNTLGATHAKVEAEDDEDEEESADRQ